MPTWELYSLRQGRPSRRLGIELASVFNTPSQTASNLAGRRCCGVPVSYTHLTLPTICSV
eukprot:8791909-Alexandrium_andersonii.AAC.1